MANRFLKRANQRISLGGAATLLIATTFVGQLLGFLRTMLVNASFSELGHDSTDAYFAAFKIPDFFFLTLAAGALGVAFIPILTERLSKSDRKGVWDLSNSLLNLMAVLMAFVGVVIFVAAEPLMRLVASDLTPEQLHNATTIMRLVAFNPLMFTISGVLTAIQQTFGRFFFFAIGPIVYNLCIIVSIFVFRSNIGLTGLGIGALVGGIIQLLTASLGLTGLGYRYSPRINLKNKDFKRILRQLPPRSLDQGVDSINSMVETNRARKLGEGYLTYYENAFTLHTAPILLFGTAIATAAFPRLTERLAQNRVDLFRKEFLQVLQFIIWIGAPIVVLCYFSRGYLARLIFKTGAPNIALIFGFLTFAILFRMIYMMFSRYFYAHKDTATPLIVSLFAICLNIVLAFSLARPQVYGAAGLAIAQSIVAASEVLILFVVILWRDPHLFNKQFWASIMRIVSVTGFTVVGTYLIVALLPLNATDRGFFALGFKLGGIVLVTMTIHVMASLLFGLEEASAFLKRLRQFALKTVRI